MRPPRLYQSNLYENVVTIASCCVGVVEVFEGNITTVYYGTLFVLIVLSVEE